MSETTTEREFSTLATELGEKIVGLTLKEAKELSDYLKEVHGIEPASGGAVMVAAPGAGGGEGAAAEEEKTEFDVVLENFGDKKIGVIKASDIKEKYSICTIVSGSGFDAGDMVRYEQQ